MGRPGAAFDPEEVVRCGSRARGTARPDSDADPRQLLLAQQRACTQLPANGAPWTATAWRQRSATLQPPT